MSHSIKLDFAKIPKGREVVLRLLLELRGEAGETLSSPQLNLGLVLDRSGSMSGKKLEQVKAATMTLLGRLSVADRVSLTIFDDVVDTLIQPRSAGMLAGAAELVTGVAAGGSTFLSGGYERGFQLTRPAVQSDVLSRVLLLTDGLANVGVRDPERLCAIAREYRRVGVSTTTIGVGEDYDEALLGKLAEFGGGATYFIEKAEDAVSVFEEEVGALQSLWATACAATFTPHPDVRRVRQLNSYARGDGGEFELGDLYRGQVKRLLLEIVTREIEHAGRVYLGDLDVRMEEWGSGAAQMNAVRLPVMVDAVPPEEFSSLLPDHDVALQSASLLIAAAKGAAMRYADEGSFVRAAQILEECLSIVAGLRLDDRQITEEVTSLQERARELRNRGSAFYSATERKRLYYEAEMGLKSRDAAAIMMKERRAGRA